MISVCRTNKIEKYVLCGRLAPRAEKETNSLPVQQVTINRKGGETIECLCAVDQLQRINIANPVMVFVQHEGGRELPEVIAIYNDDVDPETFECLEHRISEILGGSLDE